MNRRTHLRRTGILCLHFVRNAAYYRAWNAAPIERRQTGQTGAHCSIATEVVSRDGHVLVHLTEVWERCLTCRQRTRRAGSTVLRRDNLMHTLDRCGTVR